MNIVFVTNLPPASYLGGVERVTESLAKGLKERGHNILFFSLQSLDEETCKYEFVAPLYTLPDFNIKKQSNIEFYQSFIKKNNIDILINQSGVMNECEFILNTNNKCKKITVIHNDPLFQYHSLWEELTFLKNNSKSEHIKRLVRCLLYPKLRIQALSSLKSHYKMINDLSWKIVFLSKHYIEDVKLVYPELHTKSLSIPNPNVFIQEPYPIKKKNEILYVGRLFNRTKRIDRLLRIWKKIEKFFPTWELSILGDGEDRLYLESLAKKNNLKRCTFYGNQDPKDFYRRAKILCMTSNYEGFPMVITEAMQFGCVPIAYNSFKSLNEIVINNHSGIIIPPFNEKKFIKELQALMSDNEKLKYLANNAYHNIQKYSLSYILDLWEEVFMRDL